METPEANPSVDEQSTPGRRSNSRHRVQRTLLVFLVVPYLGITILAILCQRMLIYRPEVAGSLAVQSLGLPENRCRDVLIETQDGDRLRGWLLQAQSHSRQSHRSLIIYFPGNAGHRYYRWRNLQEFVKAGFDVLIFDYRGFGDSTGSPSELRLTADARAIWDFAEQQLDYSPRRTVVFGESLGGAVALSLWTDQRTAFRGPAALLLNATFTSMTDTVRWHYPFFPFQLGLRDTWNSLPRIRRVRCPITIFHGTEDQIVPIEHGRMLASFAGNANLIEVSGGSHNSFPVGSVRRVLERLRLQLKHADVVKPTGAG